MSMSDVTIDTSADVYYHELDNTPGFCVDFSDETRTWSPVKVSQKAVMPVSAETSDSELDISDSLCLDYQMRHGVPGLEIETSNDDVIWVPIAHRTWSRLKPPITWLMSIVISLLLS